jgi:hypothetical protein
MRAGLSGYARDMSDPDLTISANRATDDLVDATAAAAILGEPPSTFEHRRRALALVLDRATGVQSAVPQFDDARAEKAWRARSCLIVPEWRAVTLPFGKWVYSRAALVAFREQPYAVVTATIPLGYTPSCGGDVRAPADGH